MTRPLLPASRVHPSLYPAQAAYHADVIARVDAAVQQHPVVLVGMALNPFVGQARRRLEQAGIPFHEIVIGGYFSQWKQRLALKLWAGWPTFPMVFVQGVLVGGATDLARLDLAALKAGRVQARQDAR